MRKLKEIIEMITKQSTSFTQTIDWIPKKIKGKILIKIEIHYANKNINKITFVHYPYSDDDSLYAPKDYPIRLMTIFLNKERKKYIIKDIYHPLTLKNREIAGNKFKEIIKRYLDKYYSEINNQKVDWCDNFCLKEDKNKCINYLKYIIEKKDLYTYCDADNYYAPTWWI